jgi:hypothetical protein
MRWVLLLAISLALTGAGAGCERRRATPTIKPMPEPDAFGAKHAPGALSPRIASYRIDARFDPESMTIHATQRLTWRNAGATAVTTLPFHLYMNASSGEDSVFMRESRGKHRRAEANDDAPGHIQVTSIRIGADAAALDRAFFPGKPDLTVLEVPLTTPVEPGASVAVDMEFDVQLPEVFARTGYKNQFAMIGQWFPKIGVRVAGDDESERWHCEPFHLHSEFFADFGVYDVTLTVPETHVIAATGVLTATNDNGDGTRTLTYHAEDVHDFAWMADPFMEVLTDTATTVEGPVEVRVYHRPAQRAFAKRHLHAGVRSIEVFSELLVPYPYTMMSIVDPPPNAAGGAGGMEYPTLVTTAADTWLAPPGVYLPEFVTIHEVGHNWFQGLIASNEVDEAWLDEGVNEYFDGIVFEESYGRDTAFVDVHDWAVDFYALRRAATTWPATPIATRSFEFPNYSDYGAATYSKTALALRTLQNIVGRERFLAAIGAYAQRWAFRHPTGDDFFSALERHLGEDLDWFVQPAFYQGGSVDFRVEDIDCYDGICDVLVANRGAVPAPVDIDVHFADGEVERVRWDDRSAWRELRFERAAEVTEVTIDPDDLVLLDSTPILSRLRTKPEGTASRRAGARAQFWGQSLLQVTGL